MVNDLRANLDETLRDCRGQSAEEVPNSGVIEPGNFVFDHSKLKYEVR